MPRTRAKNYEEKKEHILNVAADMFARSGYAICKIEDIAEECGVSKSAIYHYFSTKENVLFELLNRHVRALNDVIKRHLSHADGVDRIEFFRQFIRDYLDSYASTRQRHVVTIKETRYLTKEQLEIQEQLERENAVLMREVIRVVRPDLPMVEYTVHAFLLIGMLNWVDLWFQRGGMMPRTQLADRISNLFLDGFLNISEAPMADERAPVVQG